MSILKLHVEPRCECHISGMIEHVQVRTKQGLTKDFPIPSDVLLCCSLPAEGAKDLYLRHVRMDTIDQSEPHIDLTFLSKPFTQRTPYSDNISFLELEPWHETVCKVVVEDSDKVKGDVIKNRLVVDDSSEEEEWTDGIRPDKQTMGMNRCHSSCHPVVTLIASQGWS